MYILISSPMRFVMMATNQQSHCATYDFRKCEYTPINAILKQYTSLDVVSNKNLFIPFHIQNSPLMSQKLK